MKCSKVIFLLFIGLFPYVSSAQSGVLEDYIEEGISQNLQLQKDKLNLEQLLLKAKIEKAKRLPIVALDASYLLAEGGRRIEVPLGDVLNPAYGALNQLEPSFGFPTDVANEEVQLIPNNFYDARIKAKYPIYNRAIYYNYKAKEQLISVQEAKMETYKAELRKEITIAYINYFKLFKILEVYDLNETFLNELLQFNLKLLKYNKVTEYATTSVTHELQKINSARADLKQKQLAAKAYFNTLLCKDFEAEILEDDDLKTLLDQSQMKSLPTIDTLLEYAEKPRPEFYQVEQGMAVNETLTKLYKKKALPTVGLDFTAGFQGSGFEFDGKKGLVTLGVGVNWLIYDGKQRKLNIEHTQIANSKLEVDLEMVKQQIRLQVNNAYYQLIATQQKMEAEQATTRYAEKTVEHIEKLYKNQKALLIEFLDARTKLTNAQIAEAITSFDLLIRITELERTANL